MKIRVRYKVASILFVFHRFDLKFSHKQSMESSQNIISNKNVS